MTVVEKKFLCTKTSLKEFLILQKKKTCNPEEIKDLHESLIFEMNQIPKEQTDVDVDWLTGTNISLPQQVNRLRSLSTIRSSELFFV